MNALSEPFCAISMDPLPVSRGDTEEAEKRREEFRGAYARRSFRISQPPPYLRTKPAALRLAWRCQAGFTLVELLVSLTLLGMLSLVLLGGLHFGRSVWQASETKTAAVDRVRAFQAALASELERAYPEIGEANATEGSKVKFDGARDRVTFLTPSPDNSGMLVQTTVRPEGFGDRVYLVEARRPELARAGREAVVESHLPAIASVRLSYFGSIKDNEAPDWHESWSNQGKFPDLVRVRVTFADRRFGWPDLIVRPRVQADVTCTFDPLARACSGR